MTESITLADRVKLAAGNLNRINEELAAAEADVALLKRLSGAMALAKRLTMEQQDAIREQSEAVEAEASAKHDARFVGMHSISVVDHQPMESVLRSSFEINYVMDAYDPYEAAMVARSFTANGFHALPDEVFLYLIEVHPSKIPAKIIELFPSDPQIAFGRYWVGLKKGFISA